MAPSTRGLERRVERSAQNWKAFLHDPANALVTIDVFTEWSVVIERFYAFVALAHTRRQVLYDKMTEYPIAFGLANQITEAVPRDLAILFLVRDNDCGTGPSSGGDCKRWETGTNRPCHTHLEGAVIWRDWPVYPARMPRSQVHFRRSTLTPRAQEMQRRPDSALSKPLDGKVPWILVLRRPKAPLSRDPFAVGGITDTAEWRPEKVLTKDRQP